MISRVVCALLAVGLVTAAASATGWKFVVAGDTRSDGLDNGVNVTILGEIANATVAQGAEFILVPGDLALSGGAAAFATWKSTMQPVYNAGIGVYPIRGNHDTGDLTAWNNAFGSGMPQNGPAGELGLTYSFTRHNALIVGLDEYISGNAHRVNQTWLDGQFAANTMPNVFVFGHEPAFKANHVDCLDDYPTNRDTLVNSILAEGGRSMFVGHDHFYDHARIGDADGGIDNDFHQFIVGDGGAPFYTTATYDGANGSFSVNPVAHDAGAYGYELVEVDGLNVTMTHMRRTSPGVFTADDVFSYTATPEPAALSLLVLGGLAILRKRRIA